MELKPCPNPWCTSHEGHRPSIEIVPPREYHRVFNTRCVECELVGPDGNTEAEAITAWNTRADYQAGIAEGLRMAAEAADSLLVTEVDGMTAPYGCAGAYATRTAIVKSIKALIPGETP